ncbi:transposase [Rhodobacter viridis]|uniref:Transposase n=1 Tax=Rhodobacter viridis TaxID=1054202 RepID=A0A318TY72_9RHOB|nr:transposase [Rhodobacter viridis]
MKLFVGLDVSLEKTAICMISEHGKIMKEAQVASEPEALLRWLCRQDGTIAAVGLEAGPLSQWLHRGLSEAGQPVVLMETRQVKGALKAMPIKTDRRDAEGIARLLHLGWFRPVHCKSVSAQEVRAVLGDRKAVQQGFITLEMSLRGLLRNFGLKVGAISRGRFENRIRELSAGNPMLEAATEPMLRARSALRQELAGLERHVRQLSQADPVCRRLMTMPGIGAVVALTYRSAVDDPARFTSSKKVGPWVGLTPSRNQSGERDVSGGITKAGDVNLRRALCQAATVMMYEEGQKTVRWRLYSASCPHLEFRLGLDHCVEDRQQLVCRCGEYEFDGFSCGSHSGPEGAEDFGVARSVQGRDVEHAAHIGPAASNATLGQRSLPLSCAMGARPANAAMRLRHRPPSSGSSAISVAATMGPTPGTLCMRRETSVSFGSRAISAMMRASKSRMCRPRIVTMARISALATGSAVWARRVISSLRASTSCLRRVASACNCARISGVAAVRGGCMRRPNSASMRASTRSVLARSPDARAKSRACRGLRREKGTFAASSASRNARSS